MQGSCARNGPYIWTISGRSAIVLRDRASLASTRSTLMETTDMGSSSARARYEAPYMGGVGSTAARSGPEWNRQKLDERFKDTADPLRMVFVCSARLWRRAQERRVAPTITSTAAMRNQHAEEDGSHGPTRVSSTEGEEKGDRRLLGVFRGILEKELAIFDGRLADAATVDSPIADKTKLVVAALSRRRSGGAELCERYDVDLDEFGGLVRKRLRVHRPSD